DPALSEQVLRIHRAALIPEERRRYLVAALGSVSAVDTLPQGWNPPPFPENMWSAENRAMLADSLAGRIGAETHLEQERRRFERTLDVQRQTAESTLEKEREKWNLVLRTELIAWESLRRRTFQGIHEYRALFESQLLSYWS